MTSAPVSLLRQRMIDDMRLRQYGEKTQHDYIREVAAGGVVEQGIVPRAISSITRLTREPDRGFLAQSTT